MNIQFSHFDGYSDSNFIEPFHYWNDFINDEFSNLKIDSDFQTVHFHCCVFAKNDDFAIDEYLSDFVKKLPLFTLNVNQKHIDFWLLTPELQIVENNAHVNNYDKIAIALLDTLLQSLSKAQKHKNDMNFSDFANCFINAKHKIAENGVLFFREKFKNIHEKEFKNKYWL